MSIPDNEDLGTADSLRLISEKLKSDVLIVSCDLISNVNLQGVLDIFRTHNASVASLLVHPQQSETVIVPGPKSKHKPGKNHLHKYFIESDDLSFCYCVSERDIIGIDQQTNRTVFLASASDFENELTLPTKLLKKHTNVKMYSTLVDTHIYVLKNWVVQYLKSQESFMSIER